MKHTLKYDDIPLVSMISEISRSAALVKPGRRGVVLGMLTVGSGMALNLLSTLTPARAHHATYSKHPTYCGGRNYAPQPCSNANTSGGFCASNGWHRHDSLNTGNGTQKVHWVDESRCWGYNAWEWRHTNGTRYRCSDGGFKYVRNGEVVDGPYQSVCSAVF